MMNVKKAFEKIEELFLEAGVDSPAFEVSVLMEDLLNLPRNPEITVPETVLKPEEEEKLFSAAEKRAKGYPLQYLIGNWEFFGRKFFVGEGVLIPRPETELLCETVLKYFSRTMPPKIVDLCSGSGCIAITLAKELGGANVTAVELYKGAFEYLERNNAFHGNCVKTALRDALEPFEKFDCVVSNPPYITGEEMKELQTEVTFEPKTALFGGTDGLDFYRAIAKNWFEHLNEGGLIAFEIGDTQGEAVKNILTENGYKNAAVIKDYENRDRVVTAIKL
ncbi:MAG: peptide chain release factor N(5)-glutamine methyltransferase [Oscillospiraceae bacterium]|nr:peptide chain release factor N(5)-glutamine methyltransferase [Oscillospiraceae bacterium]MBP1575025.1 peptide chain release factor N(5)-glutamine methyltransferase [Oscillospiraceae bacterium]